MKIIHTYNPYHSTPNDDNIIIPHHHVHVALSCKSYRVFGLNNPAWSNAREEWKLNRGGDGGDEGGGGNDDDKNDDNDDDEQQKPKLTPKQLEEQQEIKLICNAIVTSLKEDAGGYGTAGFHMNKVTNVQQLNPGIAIYNAELVPCETTGEPINPMSLLSPSSSKGEEAEEEEGEEMKKTTSSGGTDSSGSFTGNDEFYLSNDSRDDNSNKEEEEEEDSNNSYDNFQLRIIVSKASVGLAINKYHEALFKKRKELDDEDLENSSSNFDVDEWINNDEELSALRQNIIDASTTIVNGQGDSSGGETTSSNGQQQGALGYYVQVLLLEPQIPLDANVIAPPVELDKSLPTYLPSSSSNIQQVSREEEYKNHQGTKSVFQHDIYKSTQFTKPIGKWERLNILSFMNVVLDVKKALIRVEFPLFPEGCKDKTFREVYQLNARLKSGSFATVCRGTHRATGKKIAVKCVLRKDLPASDDAAIYDEVLILSTLRHSYICPLIDFFEERECYFLIMELMSGGDLFDRIGQRKSYTENDARDLCRKMLESLRYCHENSVAHCDMKPKNLLLVSDDDDVQVKLADFGFATRVYEPKSLTKQCGTPFFVAPEVLMRSPYDQQSDMWSCGVIMFLLLGGDLPFVGRSQKELFRNIVMGKYEFEEDSWAHVSEEAKHLVKQLLVTDPSKRLSSREALNSSWMRQRGSMLAMNKLQHTSTRLAGFNARHKLRASMLAITSVRRMMISARSMESEKNATGGGIVSKRPSFLEVLKDEEDEDD